MTRLAPDSRLFGRGGSWLIPALVMFLLLSACSGDDTHLPALMADPMADYEPEGVVLVDAWERAEGRDWFFRKPTHAEVVRTYRILDQSQADQILEEAAAHAEANGWRLTESLLSPANQYRGAKELAPGSGRISIAVGPDPLQDETSTWILRVHLDFGSVRFDETTTTSVVEGG